MSLWRRRTALTGVRNAAAPRHGATMRKDSTDPKALIAESYRIEGITEPECRSIFLDWALSVDAAGGHVALIEALLARHCGTHPDHPMTAVLQEGLGWQARSGRRGGAAARRA